MHVTSQDLDGRMELLYVQMLKALDFVWEQESVGLTACVYDACFIAKKEAVLLEQPVDVISLNSLIVRALFPPNKSNGSVSKQSQGTSKKIPDDLITNFFASKADGEFTVDVARENFKRSIAGSIWD